MINERTIINALIIAASFIVVPFLISSTLTVDYLPVAMAVCLLALIIAFFFVGDRLALYPLLAGNVTGALNFLPLPLDAVQIASVFLVLYFITGYVLIRKTKMKLGPPRFFWPMTILLLIMLIHNHSFALRMAGSEGGMQGARPAYFIYLAAVTYFCGINYSLPSVRFFSRVPFYSVMVAVVWSIPFLLSTFIPGLAPFLYVITSQVNVEAYLGTQGLADDGISRMGALGALGTPIQAYLVSRYPMGSWLIPGRWWVLVLSLICTGLAAMTGYRNSVFSFAIITVAAAWCHYSWRSLLISGVICLPIMVGALAVSNEMLPFPANQLPPIVQRSLSFIPANWDEEVVESGKASNEFRKGIEDLYMKEFAMQSPWIGNGYNIDSEEFNNLNEGLQSGRFRGDTTYFLYKMYIVGKMFHTGWLSLYDIVGLIGAGAFLWLAASELLTLGGWIFDPKADRSSTLFPLYVWLFANITNLIVSFFAVFGDFGPALCDLVVYALVISMLIDVRKISDAPVASGERRVQSDITRTIEGRYGYQTRY